MVRRLMVRLNRDFAALRLCATILPPPPVFRFTHPFAWKPRGGMILFSEMITNCERNYPPTQAKFASSHNESGVWHLMSGISLNRILLPDSTAILKDLLAPDRDFVLDTLDDVFASFEGLCAVDS